MKIIDTHTHLPGFSFGKKPIPVKKLRKSFEDAGLYKAWFMTTDGLVSDPKKNNDILKEYVKNDLDFFVPFCTVDPKQGATQAVKELNRAKNKLGMKGLKLHPWLQAFSMTHPAVLPVLKEAGRLNMPVLFHDGTPPYCTPLQIAEIAEAVPETTFILGHAGLDDLYQDAIIACNRLPNVYLCCCSISSGYISKIIKQCPAEKLLYGSDGGFGKDLISDALNKIYAVETDKSILEKIFFKNPSKLIR